MVSVGVFYCSKLWLSVTSSSQFSSALLHLFHSSASINLDTVYVGV